MCPMRISDFATMAMRPKLAGSKSSVRGRTCKRFIRDFLVLCEGCGLSWSRLKSGHIRVTRSDGSGRAVLSSTPSVGRKKWSQVARSTVRRELGVDVMKQQ